MNGLAGDVAGEIASRLSERQGGRTDEEFARVLGCTRAHWSFIRSGRRRMSYAMLKRLMPLFPELAHVVMRDLTSTPTEKAS